MEHKKTRKYTKYKPGMKFGKLTLVRRTEGGRMWECVCECGNPVFTQISQGARECKECFYKRMSKEKTVHGDSNDKNGACKRLYRIWTGMKTRCNNPNNHTYKYYGMKNIKVCEDWEMSYVNFKDWALINGYSDKLEIDRIDFNGNYCPENCRWVTRGEQMNNTSHNRNITIDSKTHTFAEWLKIIEVKKPNVYKNSKKQSMSVEEYLKKDTTQKRISHVWLKRRLKGRRCKTCRRGWCRNEKLSIQKRTILLPILNRSLESD